MHSKNVASSKLWDGDCFANSVAKSCVQAQMQLKRKIFKT